MEISDKMMLDWLQENRLSVLKVVKSRRIPNTLTTQGKIVRDFDTKYEFLGWTLENRHDEAPTIREAILRGMRGVGIVIGLTGGVGCGKSTVAKIFEEKGYVNIDCDEISHEVLRENDVIHSLIYRYGGGILTRNYEIDRRVLGNIIFSDENERKWLESLMRHRIINRLKALIVVNRYNSVVVQAPLLFEWEMEDIFHCIVAVHTSDERQKEFLEKRGLNPTQIEQRIKAQMPKGVKTYQSDFVILNNSNEEILKHATEHTIQEILLKTNYHNEKIKERIRENQEKGKSSSDELSSPDSGGTV